MYVELNHTESFENGLTIWKSILLEKKKKKKKNQRVALQTQWND
jgi:hypothetical protein